MADKYTPTESSAPVHPTSERTLQSYLRPPRSTLSRPPSPSSPPPRGSAKRGLVEIIWKQLKNRQTLSSLSTALQIQRNISVATPHTSNIPSKIFRWFTCAIRMLIKATTYRLLLTLMTNLPTSTAVRISLTILTHSASGIMASYSPAMSKSH